ncbi:MAG TPA: tripartite tricarboxylate transporter substrate binding protein [Burkholderiales bacterium]|nr:tripartite tricarboxylate transporter substrate binding protein [Burkholderiales bacterium]
MKSNSWLVRAACALVVCLGSVAAYAQSYPSKTIRLIMPYPAGGSTDTVGRLIAERLSANLGQPVVVDNRPGASAQIGMEAALKAPPDGYTLVMVTSTNAINHALNPKLPYDFPRDFQPIALVAKAAQLLVVHPSIPVRTVKDFVALARSRPGQLSYASSGTGTSGHLCMEAFARDAKISLIHVPYKGNQPAINDLLGGQVAAGFQNIVSVVPQVKAKRLTALGVSSAKRSALAPDVPTIAELGFPGFDITAWFGIAVPAGVPQPIVDRLSKEIETILGTQQMRERLVGMGVDPSTLDSAKEFSDFVATDIKRWTRLVQDIRLKPTR